jgi:uncharacterized repeat protein (TIGR03803 family)
MKHNYGLGELLVQWLQNSTGMLFPIRGSSLRGRREADNVGRWRRAYAVFLLCAATAIASSGTTTFTNLVSFDKTDGAYSYFMSLVQGRDGNFYGTTRGGGIGYGTIFKITASGMLTTIHNFCSLTGCHDGGYPYAGLVLGTDGNFYGTTEAGGTIGYGTVFKITAEGMLTTLYNFCSQTRCHDGGYPFAALVQATDGNFYGTTEAGGAHDAGTLFEITVGGKLTTLYSFCSLVKTYCTDGAYPYAGLVQATNGNFYGTTIRGGTNNYGTVFEITGGKLTTLYNFCSLTGCHDGAFPVDGLVQAADGNFYGTTEAGGAVNRGMVFEMTAGGKLTTLYSFCSQSNCTDGLQPDAGLVQATDGNFYGTTYLGGANNRGTVFEITPARKLTDLHSFDVTDGVNPYGGLLQATNGNFYGTTFADGAYGYGTVFSLSVGLGQFVETNPTSGKVGAKIGILGQGFASSSIVKFGGVHATTVTLTGTTFLTATVPAGALTGSVTVTTGSMTLKSNKIFRVIPQITSFNPTSGPVGTVVTITGVSLNQTVAVTFGGVKATAFTVESNTQVKATVPTGAKTGKIGITTPGGTATSSTTFTVTP